jgi:hypothetical protein
MVLPHLPHLHLLLPHQLRQSLHNLQHLLLQLLHQLHLWLQHRLHPEQAQSSQCLPLVKA